MNLGRARRPAARHAAADVHPVAGAGEQREQFAVGEVGRHQHDVLQVRAADIGIVDDPHVARLEAAFLLDERDQVGDGELHVGEEHRQAVAPLRDGLARDGMEDAVRAVVGLGDDRRDRRMDEMQIHLVADLLQRAAHDRECDGVGHAASTIRL